MPEEVTGRLLPEGVGPSVEVEKAVLREVQMAFRERTTSTALAIGAAGLVFACLPESAASIVQGLRKGGLYLAPALCVVSLFFVMRTLQATVRMKELGIPRARGFLPRFWWETAGVFLSLAVVSTICGIAGWTLRSVGVGMLPGLLAAIWIGRRLEQIPTYDEARQEQNQALSLRQDDDQGSG